MFEATIGAIVPRADPGARTFPVRLDVLNADGAILGGMLGVMYKRD